MPLPTEPSHYPLFICSYCNSLSPVYTVCWNADQSCWLNLWQVPIAAMSSCVQQPSYVQKVVFHSIPPHPLALTFFSSPLPLCSLSLGVLIQLSHLWLTSEQSFILSILMIIMNHYISCCPTVERSFSDQDRVHD